MAQLELPTGRAGPPGGPRFDPERHRADAKFMLLISAGVALGLVALAGLMLGVMG